MSNENNETLFLRPVFRTATKRDENDQFLDAIIKRWVPHDPKGKEPFLMTISETSWLLMEVRQLRLALADLEQGLSAPEISDREKVKATIEHINKVLEWDPFEVALAAEEEDANDDGP